MSATLQRRRPSEMPLPIVAALGNDAKHTMVAALQAQTAAVLAANALDTLRLA